MVNYCIILTSTTYLHVFEPFLRRRHLIIPVLFMGEKVAVYIRRKSVVSLLELMMKGEIDGNSEVVKAFASKLSVEHPHELKPKIYS